MMPAPWKQWEGQVVDLCFPLRRCLGSTGRSAVYLTQYEDPEPRVAAIKLVLAETPEADLTAEWERAAQLSHPSILRLLRIGRCQVNQSALRYAVTEYAEENLAEVLAERPLTTAEVREFLKPLLEALAYIHGEGLVHGHLKPTNIMAVGDELKLSVDGVTLVGEPGAAPGTPGPYDPPEFRERGRSPVGDVWSLGVTLVEALTQQLPTAGGPKEEPVLPETLPAEFLPIVRACLQPDPRRRASLAEIRELIARPEPALAASAPARDGRQGSQGSQSQVRPAAPRKWMSTILVGAAAVVLAGIFAGPHLFRRPMANTQTEQVAVAPAAVPAPSGAPKQVAPAPAEPKPSPMSPPAERRRVVEPPPTAAVTHPAEHTVESASGQVVRQIMPDVPDYARRTIRGTVKIQVRASVDAAGHVTDAKVESQNSKYFAKLTLEAARQWEFAANTGDWLLRFEFTPEGSSVRPTRVGR